jgi:hypothetical protein
MTLLAHLKPPKTDKWSSPRARIHDSPSYRAGVNQCLDNFATGPSPAEQWALIGTSSSLFGQRYAGTQLRNVRHYEALARFVLQRVVHVTGCRFADGAQMPSEGYSK